RRIRNRRRSATHGTPGARPAGREPAPTAPRCRRRGCPRAGRRRGDRRRTDPHDRVALPGADRSVTAQLLRRGSRRSDRP
ncbi:hypothetical protein C6A85_08290, partial [Mycobacterium sp. ITM-2017-0098]